MNYLFANLLVAWLYCLSYYIPHVSVSMGIAAINDAIDADDVEALMTGLSLPDVALQSVLPDCRHSYLEKLQQLKVAL